MKVEVEKEGLVEVPKGSTGSTLLGKLGYHLDSTIVLLDGSPVPLDHQLEDGMTLKVVSVVSGG